MAQVPNLTLASLSGTLEPGDTAQLVALLPDGWGPQGKDEGPVWVTLTGAGLYGTQVVELEGRTLVHAFDVEKRFGSAVYASVAYPTASGRWEERTVGFRIIPAKRTDLYPLALAVLAAEKAGVMREPALKGRIDELVAQSNEGFPGARGPQAALAEPRARHVLLRGAGVVERQPAHGGVRDEGPVRGHLLRAAGPHRGHVRHQHPWAYGRGRAEGGTVQAQHGGYPWSGSPFSEEAVAGMRILISGAGIAGPTLAYWLAHHGFEPTLLERAPRLRTGGYIIDFWGLGYDIAERMGLMPELHRKGYRVENVRFVDTRGRRITGFSGDVFGRLTHERYMSLPRGELASTIFGAIGKSVDTLFGDEIVSLTQTAESVRVSLAHGGEREFDLVIGGDGLHSKVREQVFGPQVRFEKYLGYQVAAFEVIGYRPRDEEAYVLYTLVGQQVARFAMRDDRTMFLFVFKDSDPTAGCSGDLPSQKKLLRERFAESGWECPQILDAMDSLPEIYFDRVSQIRMDRWSEGRVALVGDAAFCVSLLAGQGSALAMTAAYVLAGELKRAGGDYRTAFARYQEVLSPFIAKKQAAAERFAGSFAPASQFSLFLRNQIVRLLSIPFVADLALGRDLRDTIELPDYGA